MENHIGLVRISNGRLIGVQYYVSKFERDLGETIKFDGIVYNVGVIGKNRNSVVEHLNIFIKNQNRINRKINASNNIEARIMWAEILQDTLNYINH